MLRIFQEAMSHAYFEVKVSINPNNHHNIRDNIQ